MTSDGYTDQIARSLNRIVRWQEEHLQGSIRHNEEPNPEPLGFRGVTPMTTYRDVASQFVENAQWNRVLELVTNETPTVRYVDNEYEEEVDEELTDEDVDCGRYKIFIGDSVDDFSINYELDRFKDKLSEHFVPIVILRNKSITPIIQAWSTFHKHALIQLVSLTSLSNLLNDLDNRKPMVVTAYQFGSLSPDEADWTTAHYRAKRIEWIKVTQSGAKYRRMKKDT